MKSDILIIDDEEDIRMVMEGILEDEGHSIRQASNSDEALAAIKQKTPDLVILDIWLENSKLDGMGILVEITKNYKNLPVIMISGHGNIETAVSTIQIGAYDFIEKPFTSERLLLLVDRALEIGSLKKENFELKTRSGNSQDSNLLGKSSVINQLKQVVEKVAPTGSRILITGKAGTGKEVLSRMIHNLSTRTNNPFVSINCATMHPNDLEAEIFGKLGKIGALELANTGTLFLDEISDMSLETQGKMVRALQLEKFSKLDSDQEMSFDIRIIASTNKNLSKQMEDGNFRQDLYYRLNVVPIHMPSLFARKDDIPELVNYFMDKFVKSSGMQPKVIADDALQIMQAYNWPGNVRQLQNIVEWLLIMTNEDLITADMLPPEITLNDNNVLSDDKSVEMMSKSLREAREIFETEYLFAQVKRFQGNISKTANFVGMERSALHRKLRSLGINDKINELQKTADES